MYALPKPVLATLPKTLLWSLHNVVDLRTQPCWQRVQLVQRAFIVHPVAFTRSALCGLEVTAVYQVGPVALLRCPLCVRPDARPFAVGRSIHTIINDDKWQPRHYVPCFEQPRIWIFDEPVPRLKVLDDFATPCHKPVSSLKVPGRLRGCARLGILGAVRRGPYDVEVALWKTWPCNPR